MVTRSKKNQKKKVQSASREKQKDINRDNSLCCKICNEIKDYFLTYRLSNLTRSKNRQSIVEIGIFTILLMLGVFLFLNLSAVGKNIIPRNLDPTIVSLNILLFSMGLLFILAILVAHILHPKYQWVNAYLMLGLLVWSFYKNPGTLQWIGIGLLLLLFFPSILQNWKKPDWTVVIILLFSLLFLTIGLYAIDSWWGDRTKGKAYFNMCDTAQQTSYNMSCQSESDRSLANYELICKFEPGLDNIRGYVEYKLNNGSKIAQNFTGSYVPPEEVQRISFRFNATDSESNSLCLSTTYLNEFITFEEYKSNQEKFIIYLLGLLNLVIIVIPIMILQIKKEIISNRK